MWPVFVSLAVIRDLIGQNFLKCPVALMESVVSLRFVINVHASGLISIYKILYTVQKHIFSLWVATRID
jgi:hypothetical protein